MKRYIALLLAFALLLPCLVVPASATTQGVIDAVESLESTLDASQSAIVGWLESIFDQIDIASQDIVTAVLDTRDLIEVYLIEMTDTLLANISSYLKKIQDFFYSGAGYQTVNTIIWTTSKGPQLSTKSVYAQNWLEVILLDSYSHLVSMLCAGFNAIWSAITGSSTLPDSFEDNKTPVETEADSMIDSMETSPTINVEDIETQVEQVTQFEPDTDYLDILSSIFLNEVFLTMFSWSIIFAMLGYILYGKV